MMKVIEKTKVSPLPNSVPSPTILPLVFFDLPWFHCHPIHRIFFYHFPHPTHHFLQTTLPILKHSLSLTLQHFFPFSSNLIIPPNSQDTPPYIRYLHTDTLSFTVAESSEDFNLLISDSQDAQNWHPLVPNLPPTSTEQNNTRVIPIMAIQVTVMPNSGFSICLTFNHVAADGKSLHHFMKFWASISKNRANKNDFTPLDLPSHERDRLKDPKGLKNIYLLGIQNFNSKNMEFTGFVRDSNVNKIRTTLVLSFEQIQKLKKWVAEKCKDSRGTQHVSTFVVTSSLIWFCMVKTEESERKSDDLCYFSFLGDCCDSAEVSLPKTYFGNCIHSLIVAVKRDELVGKNGIVVASNGIEKKIRDFKSNALLGAESGCLIIGNCENRVFPPVSYIKAKITFLDSFKTRCILSIIWTRYIVFLMNLKRQFLLIYEAGGNTSFVTIAGSPKLAVYETDFGWGKPKKSDSVHLESSGSISLSDCRDGGNGIEIGLAHERSRMTNFISIFQEQLDNICSM